jgi:hypothetical protein
LHFIFLIHFPQPPPRHLHEGAITNHQCHGRRRDRESRDVLTYVEI